MRDQLILLVDDDPGILMTVGGRLEFEGYKVIRAPTGESALKEIRLRNPDLLILDIGMPGMSGISVLREITDSNGETRFPVLIFTARSQMADFFEGIKVAGFFAKSGDPEDMLRMVHRLLHAPEHAPAAAPVSPAQPTKTRGTIVVGEDDPVIAESIKEALLHMGYDAQIIRTGPAVIEKVLVEKPTAIVLKYYLPGMNGPVVASTLETVMGKRMAPVVLYDDTTVHHGADNYRGVKAVSRSHLPVDVCRALESVL